MKENQFITQKSATQAHFYRIIQIHNIIMTWRWYLLCAKGIRHVYVASFIYFFFSLMFAAILRLGYGFPHFTQGYVTHSRSCTLSSG